MGYRFVPVNDAIGIAFHYNILKDGSESAYMVYIVNNNGKVEERGIRLK